MSIGDALSAGRREAGLSITQVSQRTCIRETIIRGIERDDYSGCGGDFYTRGHIRSIARAVSIDSEPLIREYDATQAPHAITAADIFEPSSPIRLRERRRPNWSLAMLVVLLAIVGGGIFYAVAGRSAGPAAASGRPPRVTAPAVGHSHRAAPVTTPAGQPQPHQIVIHLTAATEDCWVELTTPAGQLIYQGTVPAGTSMTWTERKAVDLRLGNPGAVLLTVNGRSESPGAGTQPITLSLGPAIPAVG